MLKKEIFLPSASNAGSQRLCWQTCRHNHLLHAKKPAKIAGLDHKRILFFHLHRLHQVSFDYSIIVFFGIRRVILHVP